MIFSCTKKVITKINKYKQVENIKEDASLHNWYVDLINLERKNYFLFTNSISLFSFFMYMGTKNEIQNFESLFIKKLEEQILREIGTNEDYIKALIPKEDPFRFVKTNSRTVLGSMNEIKFQIKVQLDHRGPLAFNYDMINHLINDVLMGGLKYMRPTDKMRMELENFFKK